MESLIYERRLDTRADTIFLNAHAATRINDRDILRRVTRSGVKQEKICKEAEG
jgi:hypothetical protein